MMRSGPNRERVGLDVPVHADQSLYLQIGEHAVVRVRYDQTNPRQEVVWVGQGDRWITQVIYATKSWLHH
ncbi:hypothetical protein PHMEG_00034579 [Phytophthora megakarya]|uniref:Aspartic protease n=1 Tax=Phytophthora megakarya TaxID=4795 RepID=A0A225UTA3_9STRA|nr:hypothetical protein PHMEG_00034579 [Phytophthora megakarya]